MKSIEERLLVDYALQLPIKVSQGTLKTYVLSAFVIRCFLLVSELWSQTLKFNLRDHHNAKDIQHQRSLYSESSTNGRAQILVAERDYTKEAIPGSRP